MMEFKNCNEEYISEAVKLAQIEYEHECEKCPQLVVDHFDKQLTKIISAVFKGKYGKVALKDGKLIGYLAFERPWDGFFGNVKGVFSPLGASAFSGKDRAKLASMLYEKVAEELVRDNICTHAIGRYAHDEEVGKSFVFNGFGLRCSDAIMCLKKRHIVDKKESQYTFCELIGKDKWMIGSLKKGLTYHMAQSPCFFPTDINECDKWFERENIRVFAARADKKLVGYIAITDEGETFITTHPSMPNICGTFVDEHYRNAGVAQSLLEYVCKVCENEGNAYLGVDCETINPTALHFWGKYFESYTYSYVRRIDERVVGYKQYLDKMWKE